MCTGLTPAPTLLCSEFTPEGRRETHLDTILLNGNNVAIVRGVSVTAGRARALATDVCIIPRSLCRAEQGRPEELAPNKNDALPLG